MNLHQSPTIPALVRMKPGALDRVGIYFSRASIRRVALLASDALPAEILARFRASCSANGIDIVYTSQPTDASLEAASELFSIIPGCDALVGLGGGKALDLAKFIAVLANRPYYAVPTSLSNDGFCSPQSSLTIKGRRKSMGARIPTGIIVDTEVCLSAPLPLWWSGIGDLVAKITAVRDWRLAFHHDGTAFNDFAALLSDATVFQFMARPERSREGVRMLANALMLNGVAMEICGSSRPASGSEHLVSHALDSFSAKPRLHGLQVGVATYIVTHLQGQGTEAVARLFDTTDFWSAFAQEKLKRAEWLEAFRRAPSIKQDFHTILSTRDAVPEVSALLETDPRLRVIFE